MMLVNTVPKRWINLKFQTRQRKPKKGIYLLRGACSPHTALHEGLAPASLHTDTHTQQGCLCIIHTFSCQNAPNVPLMCDSLPAHRLRAIADTASKQTAPELSPQRPRGNRPIASHTVPGWDEMEWDYALQLPW